ncbi:hypothetical protein PG993_011334 [Apiospora rasikravindrae]|uniref:SnoaL-like domain-containing protein n=1 Tax=Apiospora rasikravindrae TaxID=990691 RepID=A0ABR1SFI7_9PEZI
MAVSPINPVDYNVIKNTIARYCIALDTKDWALLKTAVFTPDVQADFPFNRDMRGVDAVSATIQGRSVRSHVFLASSLSLFLRLPLTHPSSRPRWWKIPELTPMGAKTRLKNIPTQHALTTQMVEIQPDGVTAKATTYFTGVHFGRGKWQGQHLTSWGSYVDTLVRDDGKPGNWLISKRTVLFTERLGEERVMEGE